MSPVTEKESSRMEKEKQPRIFTEEMTTEAHGRLLMQRIDPGGMTIKHSV
jgi:hypothetical protein